MSVVYIDVSAKIENWTADSVLAVTNNLVRVFVIPAKVKQEARAWLRDRFPDRRGSYHALILLAILVRLIVDSDLSEIEFIVIDEDYPGDGAQAKIKNELVPLLRHERPDFNGKRILFQRVKGTKADRVAREIYQLRNRRRYRHITIEDIRAVIQ